MQTLLTTQQLLTEKIRTRTAKVGIIGLGYVGLPLAVEFANAGFAVTGIDIQRTKVDALNAGRSYIQDVPSAVLERHLEAGRFLATTDFSVLAALDTVNIAVPTPLRKTKDPDMSYVVAAAEQVAKYVHPGMLVILESTTYPGTTEELLLPMFEKSGLKAGEDFFLCFSPERVDPGNPRASRPATSPRSSAASLLPAPKWARSSTRKRSTRSYPSPAPRSRRW